MIREFEVLLQSFRHDFWANRLWWTYLEEKGIGDPDRSIFQHILGAQEIWYQRCIGAPPAQMPKFEASEAKIVELNENWTTALTARADDPLIHFHRFDGTAHHLHLSKIARHVIDHGSYHRGELRGLCRARNDMDFPETGLAAFYFDPELSG